jgi:ribosomal protein S18 acetylase RimI-like enzyme
MIEIRPATPGDAEALHCIVQSSFAEYRALAVLPSALSETLEEVDDAIHGGHVFLAFHGSHAVGTVRYELEGEHLYVGRLAVLPEYRRHGIGAALMQHLEALAPTLGKTRIRLGTRQSMPINLAFYDRLGYQIVSREPHLRGPDVWVWYEKELPRPDQAEHMDELSDNPKSKIRVPSGRPKFE